MWQALEIRAPADALECIEETVCGALDPAALLGISRETWRDPRYAPTAEKTGDAPPSLCVYLAPNADAAHCGHLLQEALDAAFPHAPRRAEIQLRPLEIPDADWAVRWRDFFRPIRISSRMLVLPEWWDIRDALEKNKPLEPNPVILRILPGGAFGSGTHPTTQLALRVLEKRIPPRARVLDFGAGSGILSFAADALGAASVVAIEIDPESLPNFEENRALNPSSRIEYRIGSSEQIRPEETFDLIICNALFDRVAPHFQTLAKHLAAAGQFLYGGFLLSEKETVAARLREVGLEPSAFDEQEGWGIVETASPEKR